MNRLTLPAAALAMILACLAPVRAASAASPAPLELVLVPDAANPATPRMGDRLAFHVTIRNAGSPARAQSTIAWLTLLRMDPGHEQVVDLEDWSPSQSLARDVVLPGAEVHGTWTLRLISPGTYRAIVSVATRDAPAPAVAASAGFVVAPKPVVESARVLPVALGLPCLLAGLLVVRLRRGRAENGS
jgi:hypothetical protein